MASFIVLAQQWHCFPEGRWNPPPPPPVIESQKNLGWNRVNQWPVCSSFMGGCSFEIQLNTSGGWGKVVMSDQPGRKLRYLRFFSPTSVNPTFWFWPVAKLRKLGWRKKVGSDWGTLPTWSEEIQKINISKTYIWLGEMLDMQIFIFGLPFKRDKQRWLP